jgi:hypothetical protein
MRPAFSQGRLSLTEDGQLLFTLQKPWPHQDGVSALKLDAVQFLRRLAPLTPPPFANLIRYHGLFGPRAKLRDLLPPAPVPAQVVRPEAELRSSSASPRHPSPPPPASPP